MFRFDDLLQFFGLYAIKKLDDEAGEILEEKVPSDSRFCDICQYPIKSCGCGVRLKRSKF